MCLILKEKQEPMIAPADIECYKIVDLHEDGTYHAHVKNNFVWELGKTLKSELTMKEEERYPYPYITNGFHSYQTLKDALSILHQAPVRFEELVVVKCVIPQGSRYYNGRVNNRLWGRRCYASDALKVVEVLKAKKPLPVDDNFPYKVGDNVQLDRPRWSTFKQNKIVGVYHVKKHSYCLDIKNSEGQYMCVWVNSKGQVIDPFYQVCASIKKINVNENTNER
jgi:hypothetical protein